MGPRVHAADRRGRPSLREPAFESFASMSPSDFDISRDYNRSLAWPVRGAHMAQGVVYAVFGPWIRWLGNRVRRWWTVPLLVGLIGTALLLPLDGPIARFAVEHPPRGDIKRELEAIQQFGQGVSLVVIMVAIWLLDPSNRGRLLDLAVAAASTGLLVLFVKMMVGRPRPRPAFNDPLYFLGPLGEYPVKEGVGVRHAWEFWGGISSDLWSMPSSHTAYAVVMAVFLSRVYPRIRPLAVVLASVVGLARVWLSAHYPTDVLVGGLAAYGVAPRAIDRSWGRALWGRMTWARSRLVRPGSVASQADRVSDRAIDAAAATAIGARHDQKVARGATTSATSPETDRPSV